VKPEATPTQTSAHPPGREDELGAQLIAATTALLHRYSDRSQCVVGYLSGAKAEPRPSEVHVAELARGRPIPERVREEFFFGLHARAKRSCEPVLYPKDILVFTGDGLYEDPALGWGELAQGGVEAMAVPGEHKNNRDAMNEPAVGFVDQRIEGYPSRAEPDGQAKAASAA
jgi:hypothetical protein